MARPPDAERTHAHEHVRLLPLHLRPEPLHEPVDIAASPGRPVGDTAGSHVAGVALVVGEGNLATVLPHRVRIEVVVDVHAVDVVAGDHVADDIEESIGRSGLARIEPEQPSVAAHRIGHVHTRVRLRRGPGGIGVPDTVGIEPHVEFEAAGVRFVDREGERVVGRVGRLPHRACEVG